MNIKIEEDEWSLKDKKYSVILPMKPLSIVKALDEEEFIFLDKDIELLRQKLIEDIEEMCSKWLSYPYHVDKTVIDIINSRFGVEE